MNKIRIKDIPQNERPRERLIHNGVNNLSNEELLSIIIKNGTYNMSSKDISINILSKLSKIQDLRYITYDDLIKIKGLGISKITTILSAIELGNRINTNIDNINDIIFTSATDIYDYYKNKIGYSKQELFYCIYLDSKNKIIKEKELFKGTLNYSMVYPRDIFKEAYLLDSTSIICIHNHPSGKVFPSKQDIEITKRLMEIGALMDVRVLDHIIIGSNNYYSFLENGDI